MPEAKLLECNLNSTGKQFLMKSCIIGQIINYLCFSIINNATMLINIIAYFYKTNS